MNNNKNYFRIRTAITGSSFLLLFNILLSLPLALASEVQQFQPLTEASKVSIRGIGTIGIGMTIKEAMRVSGTKLIQGTSGGEPSCLYYHPQKPEGIYFMVTNGHIARVDIRNPKITTLSGAKIGDSESKIKALYPNRIKVEAHQYVEKGHYLILISQDPQDKNYSIIFETDGKKVTQWRAGKFPEVKFIEGCA